MGADYVAIYHVAIYRGLIMSLYTYESINKLMSIDGSIPNQSCSYIIKSLIFVCFRHLQNIALHVITCKLDCQLLVFILCTVEWLCRCVMY